MLLIADSGSTKTDWCIVDIENGKTQSFQTKGLNPRFHTIESIYEELATNLLPKITNSISHIYFYGAGCSSSHADLIVYSALQQAFPNTKIAIAEDMIGAARGVCGDQTGLVCILGTGSNSCLYDGKKIVEQIPNLGFLLGDEGSGAYLGKKLIQDFLNEEMPDLIHQKFIDTYKLDRTQLIDTIYSHKFPNQYLASFTSFLLENKKEEYIHQLITNAFIDFFEKTVCRYSFYELYPTHFVGSIAYHFSFILAEVAITKKVKIENIIQHPLGGLVRYHLNKKQE